MQHDWQKQMAEENQCRVTPFGFQLPFTGSDEEDERNKLPVLGLTSGRQDSHTA
jgi:hypothetical protein